MPFCKWLREFSGATGETLRLSSTMEGGGVLRIWVFVVNEGVCVLISSCTQEAVRGPLPDKNLQLV